MAIRIAGHLWVLSLNITNAQISRPVRVNISNFRRTIECPYRFIPHLEFIAWIQHIPNIKRCVNIRVIISRICRHRQNIVQQQNRCHAQHPKSFLSLFQFSVHSTLLLTYFLAIIYPKWRKPSRTVLSFDSLPYSHFRSATGTCEMRSPCAATWAIISVANSMPPV